MIKNKFILSATLLAMSMAANAQTTITFDSDDFAKIGVYDQWSESPFRTGALAGNAGVADNPDTSVDEVLGEKNYPESRRSARAEGERPPIVPEAQSSHKETT